VTVASSGSGRFVFPFRRETAKVRFTDVAKNQAVVDVDIRPAIQTFCVAHPNDLDCTRADLAITSVAGVSQVPPYVLLNQPANVTVRTSIVNKGPDGPVDGAVALTAAAGNNKATVTPASGSYTETNLGVNQTRMRDQVYTLTCNSVTKTPLTFTSRLSTVAANVVDPNSGNNFGQFSFDLSCMRLWQAGTGYAIGDEVVHQGAQYRCRQAHTAQTGWEPPLTYALWERINAGGNWTPQVIYQTGTIVVHQGKSYRAIQGHQAQADWPPPSVPALWAGL
jgi:hypothetical protein